MMATMGAPNPNSSTWKDPRELKGKYHPLGKSTLQWTYLDVTKAKFSRLNTCY
jgi:hypothetical protein